MSTDDPWDKIFPEDDLAIIIPEQDDDGDEGDEIKRRIDAPVSPSISNEIRARSFSS